MTKFVRLSEDGSAIEAEMPGALAALDGWTALADDDARYVAWQNAQGAQAAFAAAIAGGCQIVSTGDAAISGTYGISPQDEINITGLQGGIAAAAPWLGYYRDLAGARHTMTAAEFTAVATAILGYVEALEAALETALATGAAWSAPAQPVTIA